MLHYHTKLHYSQTRGSVLKCNRELHYHTKLHYSQTAYCHPNVASLLHYHTKLHYSQTKSPVWHVWRLLHYHTKLHYSQTSNSKSSTGRVTKCHYNIVIPYYTISLHIQHNFASIFINNYCFRKLFYCIRYRAF